MSNTESAMNNYNDLFEALLDRGSVTIKTTNPKAVRNGLQKAKTTHNELASMMGMDTEDRGMVVAAVKDKENQYTVRWKIPTSTFVMVEPEGSSDEG